MKTSLGIWALGLMVTRFVPGGYKPEYAGETTADRVRRAVEGPVEAVRRSVLRWRYIDTIAAKIDDQALREAQSSKDALRAYEIVYAALGAA